MLQELSFGLLGLKIRSIPFVSLPEGILYVGPRQGTLVSRRECTVGRVLAHWEIVRESSHGLLAHSGILGRTPRDGDVAHWIDNGELFPPHTRWSFHCSPLFDFLASPAVSSTRTVECRQRRMAMTSFVWFTSAL